MEVLWVYHGFPMVFPMVFILRQTQISVCESHMAWYDYPPAIKRGRWKSTRNRGFQVGESPVNRVFSSTPCLIKQMGYDPIRYRYFIFQMGISHVISMAMFKFPNCSQKGLIRIH